MTHDEEEWTAHPPRMPGSYLWRLSPQWQPQLIMLDGIPGMRLEVIWPKSQTTAIQFADSMGGFWKKLGGEYANRQ